MKNKIKFKLIELASQKKMIAYSDLAAVLQISYSNIDERNQLHSILGEISEDEVKAGRPMLSVLVHHKNDILRRPGSGFFKLANDLGQMFPKEKQIDFHYRMLNKCFDYWEKHK